MSNDQTIESNAEKLLEHLQNDYYSFGYNKGYCEAWDKVNNINNRRILLMCAYYALFGFVLGYF
ncbi:hypothetical protein [Alkalimarinus coralli]|uniref:hypothetical protein n=1 Tax=Alkalimarinus coralli TaxID=2935863 RepID=UPI00202AE5EF|nr:hypothetical protein [Alkalimarinus coralli]